MSGDTLRFKYRVKSTPIEDVLVDLPDTIQYLESTGAPTGVTIDGSVIVADSGQSYIGSTYLGRKFSNRCDHVNTRTYLPGGVGNYFTVHQPSAGVFYHSWAPYKAAYVCHAAAIGDALSSLGVPIGPQFLQSNAQAFANNYALQLKPDLTSVSVPNFLADIGDLTSLFKLWKSSASLARNLAGAYLNYNFGWKPTFGDIKGFFDGVFNFQRKLREFEQSLGKTFRRHKTAYTDSASASGSYSTSDFQGTCSWQAKLTTRATVGIAWTPQPLAVMTNTEKTLRGLLDTLGFQLNPRIVWDALPFTFIVDWCFNVGNWLENYSIDTLELPIHYEDGYVDVKQELEIVSQVYAYSNPGSTLTPPTMCPRMVTTERRFHRIPIFPTSEILREVGWRRPTGKQLSLGIALAKVLSK
jgi:hypothetical protein